MSRATVDDHVKFLLSCARHSNRGKVDFVEVAHEIGMVSKGAAAKRYERLAKANGMHPNGGPAERMTTPHSNKEKSKLDISKAAAAKKRKLEECGQLDPFQNNLPEKAPRYGGLETPGRQHLVKHEPISQGFTPYMMPPMHPQPFPYRPFPGSMQASYGPNMFVPPHPYMPASSAFHNSLPHQMPQSSQTMIALNEFPSTHLPTSRSTAVAPVKLESSSSLLDELSEPKIKVEQLTHMIDSLFQTSDSNPSTIPAAPQEVVAFDAGRPVQIKSESTEQDPVTDHYVFISD